MTGHAACGFQAISKPPEDRVTDCNRSGWALSVLIAALMAACVLLSSGCANKSSVLASTELEAAKRTIQSLEAEMYLSHMQIAGEYKQLGMLQRVEAHLNDSPAHAREWEWWWLRASQDTSLSVHQSDSSRAFAIEFYEDQQKIIFGLEDGRIQIWNLDQYELEYEFSGPQVPIITAALSHDGNSLITAAGIQTHVWDLPSGMLLAELDTPPDDLVMAVALSPDGSLMMTGSNLRMQIISLASMEVVHEIESMTKAVSFSPDGTRCLVAAVDGLRLLEVPTWKTIQVIENITSWMRPVFSPDSSQIIAASEDGTAWVLDGKTGEVIHQLTGHTAEITHGAFSLDGSVIVTASYDRTARTWQARTGRQRAVLSGHIGGVLYAALSPDGHRVVTTSEDQTARLWSSSSPECIDVMYGHTGAVVSAAFMRQGTRVLTGSSDHTVRIWDSSFDRHPNVYTGHGGACRFATMSPDGSMIAVITDSPELFVYSTASKEQLSKIGREARVASTTFSPDGSRLMTVSFAGVARVWNVLPLQMLLEIQAEGERVESAEFGPDGTKIITVQSDKTVKVWDSSTGELSLTLAGPDARFKVAEFSPDGSMIATGSRDGKARVWDAQTGEMLAESKSHGDAVSIVRFLPREHKLLFYAGYGVYLWNALNYESAVSSRFEEAFINTVSFNPAGSRVVTAAPNKFASVWDTATGKLLLRLSGHSKPVQSAEFSHDGTRIITASDDRSVRIWDAVPYRVRFAEREANARGEDGSAIVQAWLDEVGWNPRK
jgi:WD40 repeat protein